MAGKIRFNLFFVPDMVSRSEDMDAEREEFFGDLGRYPEAAGGVLSVCDHQVRFVRLHEAAYVRPDHFPARLADDVADEKNSQTNLLMNDP